MVVIRLQVNPSVTPHTSSRLRRMDFSPPTKDQHFRFLSSFLFGGTDAPTVRDVTWRAYLDLSRTVHHIDEADPSRALRETAHAHVEALLVALFSGGPRERDAYDAWHREACEALSSLFARRGYSTFTIGQSQKWINMGVKYGLTLASVDWLALDDSAQLRAVAHAPLDSFFLDALHAEAAEAAPPRLSTSWSRIVDYDEYFAMQRWLRRAFPTPPLDVEFHVWQRASRKRRSQPVSA